MPEPFSLSRTNQILLGLGVASCVALFLFTPDKGAHALGVLSGELIALGLMSLLVALLFWRIFGKSARAGHLAFNVVVLLAVLGHFNQLIERRFEREVDRQEQSDALEAMERSQAKLKQDIAQAADFAEVNRATDAFAASLTQQFDQLAQTAPEHERRFFQIMKECVAEQQAVALRWQATYARCQGDDIFDYARLSEPGEYDRQRAILREHIESSAAFQAYQQGKVENLAARLRAYDPDSEMVRAAIEGASVAHGPQAALLTPLLAEHIAYTETMIATLDLLESQAGGWKLEDMQVVIDDESAMAQYQALIARLEAHEAKLRSLEGELSKLLTGP